MKRSNRLKVNKMQYHPSSLSLQSIILTIIVSVSRMIFLEIIIKNQESLLVLALMSTFEKHITNTCIKASAGIVGIKRVRSFVPPIYWE